MKGKERKGRQKKRWEDNIKEWTGMDITSSVKPAEDRTRWRGTILCAKYLQFQQNLWCPNDLARLRDRLD